MFRKVMGRRRSGSVGPPLGARRGLFLWYGELSSQERRRGPEGPGRVPGG